MALIEGLGDEVTLVLGCFLLIVVLLLSWISTHTDDIPLIREVGVIVVELRTRHRNRQQNRADQQAPQEVEISQSSREGLLNASETNSGDGPESGNTDDDQGQETTQAPSVESPPGESTQSSSPSSFTSYSTSTHHHHTQLQQQLPDSERRESASYTDTVNSDNSVSPRRWDDETTDLSQPEGAIVIPSLSSRQSNLSRETNDEALRRRRVEYFQAGGISGGDSVSTDDNNRSVQGFDNVHNVTCTTNFNNRDSSGQSNVPSSDCDNNKSRNKAESAVLSESSVPFHAENERLYNQSTESGLNDGEGDSRTETLQQNDNVDNDNNTVENDDDDGNFLEGSRIRVKLKYMNETQRFVYASPDDTIGDFRRAHFQSELQDNKWVRFIFNGQDLRDDARTLQACNIENNCTMHCLVTTRQRPGERPGDMVVDDEEESMLGAMMYPLFTIILMIIWYFRIFYRQYFSAMSTVCLIGISFLLGLSYVSSMRNVNDAGNGQQQQQPPAQPQPATGGTNHPHSD